jgi:AmpD protein
MKMKIDDSFWLDGATHVPSPFFDARPSDSAPSLLVLHNISLPPGQYGGDQIEKFFTGQLNENDHPFFKIISGMRVSAHCLIRRDGAIVQFVAFNQRAWHAGQSSFAGVPRCNDYSIGIELEGTDTDPYTQAQYKALAELIPIIRDRFPAITPERITGHQYIAPLRKTDPGLVFDWRNLKSLLFQKDNIA